MKKPAIDKPLRWSPKCARCGKAKNQHQALTLRCPNGKRGPAGYTAHDAATFTDAGEQAGR